MKKPITRAAVIAGTSLLAATLLTGCSGEKHTFSGLEVTGLDKTIEALDASWSQHRTKGPASSVDDGSRCFVQTGKDGALDDKALCGPVRYLGDDEAWWDSVTLESTPDGKEKVTLAGDGDFDKNKPKADATLYRTDGKKPADGAGLTEPDATAAEADKALYGSNYGNQGASREKVDVLTPDGTVTVGVDGISDRIGNSGTRLKAGDGRKFATVTIGYVANGEASGGTDTPSPKTKLAFVTGGKTYPLGIAQTGTISMSLPGDGSDVALAVDYEDLKQSVTLADATLHTTATAYYDKISKEAQTPVGNTKIGDSTTDQAFFATVGGFTLNGTRSAYNLEHGAAPEGKAWLRLTGNTNVEGPGYYGIGRYGRSLSGYLGQTTVSAAAVTNAAGATFTGELKSLGSKTGSSSPYMNTAAIDVLFLVPADATDFNVALTLHNNGRIEGGTPTTNAPATSSLDMPVPAIKLSFGPAQ